MLIHWNKNRLLVFLYYSVCFAMCCFVCRTLASRWKLPSLNPAAESASQSFQCILQTSTMSPACLTGGVPNPNHSPFRKYAPVVAWLDFLL